MIKYFNEKNIIFHKLLFPYKPQINKNKAFKKDSVIVGFGGNVGDVYWTFKKVFHTFKKNKKIKVENSSPLFKNPPFGFLKQNDFINAVLLIKTSMKAEEFLRYILRVEKLFGRIRIFENSPRTIDIDIIYFKNKKINKKNLIIPHKEWQNRLSVIIPLHFI